VLAALAASMRDAVWRATTNSLLGTAALFTLPPAQSLRAHSSAETSASAARHSQPSPTPLSPQRSDSAHRTHDGGSARAGQTLGSACLIKMVNSAWAGDVRWVCSRAGWTGTPPHPPPPGSQAACAPCRFSKP